MKARIVEIEGSPEEVAQVLTQVQGAGTTDDVATVETEASNSSGIPGHVQEWFSYWKVRNPQRQYIEQVVRELLSWGDVEVKILAGRQDERFSGRLRFLRSDGSEAFGVLGRRGVLYLQLPKDFDVSGYTNAKQRDIKSERHPVRTFVRSRDAVDEAIELLRAAYERQAEQDAA